jgi:hypothetical protein
MNKNKFSYDDYNKLFEQYSVLHRYKIINTMIDFLISENLINEYNIGELDIFRNVNKDGTKIQFNSYESNDYLIAVGLKWKTLYDTS